MNLWEACQQVARQRLRLDDSLQANTVFWALYWRRSTKGGHYEFELPAR